MGVQMPPRQLFLTVVTLLFSDQVLLAHEEGILMEYVHCLCSPAVKSTETIYCKYLVSRDSWVLQTTGYAPHWTAIGLWPYPADFQFISTPEAVEIREVRSELAQRIPTVEIMQKNGVDQASLNGLSFVRPRHDLWSLSDEHRGQLTDPSQDGKARVCRRTSPIEAEIQLTVRRTRGAWSIEQKLAGDFSHLWLQRHFSYPLEQNQKEITSLPVNGVASFSNGRFLRLDSRFENPQRNEQVSQLTDLHRRQLSILSPMGRGGRCFKLSWKTIGSIPVPERIDVTLGVEPGGMFLRTTRLLNGRVLSPTEFKQELDILQRTAPGEHRVSAVINRATELCWGKDLRNADSEVEKKLNEASFQLQAIAAAPESAGEKHMAEQQLALIALSSESVESPILRSRLERHFDQLTVDAGPQSVLASFFGLQQAICEWKRHDLLPLVWDLAQKYMEQLPLEERMFILVGMIHGLDADDLHASLLISAIENTDTDYSNPRLVRAAILQVFRLLERDRLNHQEANLWSEPSRQKDRFLVILDKQQASKDEMLQAVCKEIADRVRGELRLRR